MDLEDSLRSVVEGVNAEIGVAVAELPDGPTTEIDADRPYRAASVIKVPLLYELFRKYEHGLLNLSAEHLVKPSNICVGAGVVNALHSPINFTIEDLATLAIIVSDNSATNELIDIVGMDDVNSTMAGLGLKHTVLRRKMMGETGGLVDFETDNTMSPRDVILLLKDIYSSRNLSRSSCDRILGIMKQQKLTWKLPRYLRKGVVSATKGGGVIGVSNDVGILYLNRHVAVAVMCMNLKHTSYGSDAIASIGRTVANIFS